MQETTALILDSLRLIKDTRVDRTKRHSLELLLFVAVCAYLCGYEGFNEMELFAGENQEWLRTGLGMSGVPSRLCQAGRCGEKERGGRRILPT